MKQLQMMARLMHLLNPADRRPRAVTAARTSGVLVWLGLLLTLPPAGAATLRVPRII